MNPNKIKRPSFWTSWMIFWSGIGFLAVYPLLVVLLSRKKWFFYAQIVRRAWVNWCLFWGFIRVEQVFEEPLIKHKPYVITPNHTSKLDMLTLVGRLGIDISYMAREEIQRIPLFGIFIRTIDIPIDLNNSRKTVIAYQRGIDHLKNGNNLVIFPEGTISRLTPKLSPFKDGAFKMAIEQQVDIVPVTIIGNWELASDFGPFNFKPGKVIQYVHKPISTLGMTSRQTGELKQKVFRIIEQKLAAYGYHQ